MAISPESAQSTIAARRMMLTEKGRALRGELSGMHARHIRSLKEITSADLEAAVGTLRGLERLWMDSNDATARAAQLAR
jgi:hypothetical protein